MISALCWLKSFRVSASICGLARNAATIKRRKVIVLHLIGVRAKGSFAFMGGKSNRPTSMNITGISQTALSIEKNSPPNQISPIPPSQLKRFLEFMTPYLSRKKKPPEDRSGEDRPGGWR